MLQEAVRAEVHNQGKGSPERRARMKYKVVKYYEEWLAGQHGGHKGYEKDGWLYCNTCGLKLRIRVALPNVIK